MATFFDIPEKDKEKGLREALDLIEGYLSNPDSTMLNNSFDLNEPTAVIEHNLQETENPSESQNTLYTHTNLLPVQSKVKALLIKLMIILIAMAIAIFLVDMFAG